MHYATTNGIGSRTFCLAARAMELWAKVGDGMKG
jgi:hypothetical protein